MDFNETCQNIYSFYFINRGSKNTDTYIHIYTHIQIYKYIRTYTKLIIYTHIMTVYVKAIELDDMADTPFHTLDVYKPNLTSNFCIRLAHRTLGRSKRKYSGQCLTVSVLLVLNSFIKNLLMTKYVSFEQPLS